MREALRGGFAESRILEVHGQRMVEGDFAKRGSLAIQLKDLRNALHTSAGLGFDAPITQHLTDLICPGGRARLCRSGSVGAVQGIAAPPGRHPLTPGAWRVAAHQVGQLDGGLHLQLLEDVGTVEFHRAGA